MKKVVVMTKWRDSQMVAEGIITDTKSQYVKSKDGFMLLYTKIVRKDDGFVGQVNGYCLWSFSNINWQETFVLNYL